MNMWAISTLLSHTVPAKVEDEWTACRSVRRIPAIQQSKTDSIEVAEHTVSAKDGKCMCITKLDWAKTETYSKQDVVMKTAKGH